MSRTVRRSKRDLDRYAMDGCKGGAIRKPRKAERKREKDQIRNLMDV